MVWSILVRSGVSLVVNRVIPSIVRGIGSILGKKLSWGGALAASTAPTVLSFTDRMTGHALSESLVELPFGDGLETLLAINNWSKKEQASIPSNLITKALEEKQIIHESDLDFDRSQRMIDAISHTIIGDTFGAMSIASDIGVEFLDLDIVSAINKAKAENPEGSLGAIGTATFTDIREQLRRKQLQVSDEVDTAEKDTSTVNSFRNASQYVEELSSIRSLKADGLSSKFNSVVQENSLHMFSSVNMFFATVLDFIGFDSLSTYFKRGVITDSIISEFSKAAKNAVESDTRLENQASKFSVPKFEN